jgi:hypothetical protein
MPTWADYRFDPTRECLYLCSHFIIKRLADREASELECIISGRTSTAAFVVVMLWRVLPLECQMDLTGVSISSQVLSKTTRTRNGVSLWSSFIRKSAG